MLGTYVVVTIMSSGESKGLYARRVCQLLRLTDSAVYLLTADVAGPCYKNTAISFLFLAAIRLPDSPRQQLTDSPKNNNYKKLYTVLCCLGVFTFCTCCIQICLVCIVDSFVVLCVIVVGLAVCIVVVVLCVLL